MAAEQNNQFDPDKQKKEQRAERDLKKANIALDRKILSDIAIHDPASFGAVAKLAAAK